MRYDGPWTTPRLARVALMASAAGAFALTAAACKPQQPAGASVSQVPELQVPQVSYVLRAPEGPVPTMAVSKVQSVVRNPYDGNVGAIEQGRFLYVHMNCAYCHAFDGTGGMGPDLTDNQWRYGGSDVDIFNSIYRGRAQGMPAWGSMLPETQIWQLAAYVKSLGGPTSRRYGHKTGPENSSRKAEVNNGQ